MVTALIKVMHPSAERIDGSGGDKGREIQISADGRLELFELKSFTGRLEVRSGRRRQVEDSLKTAAKLDPAEWSLVVPIDPTPGEKTWFDKLQKSYGFPLRWLGKNWLDVEVAHRPFLLRYFVEDGAKEAIRLLTQLREENAALANGVPDALDRATKLADLLNELNPFYRFELTVGGGRQVVNVIPRYPGAESDSPIRVSVSAKFAKTREGRKKMKEFQEAFAFGTGFKLSGDELRSFSVDGPAGLGGDFQGGEVLVTPVQDPAWQLPGRLLAVDPTGVAISAIPVVYKERTIGTTGFTVTAWDRTGTLRFEQRIDRTSGKADGSFDFRVPDDAHPGFVLPVLRFIRRLAFPNKIALEVDGHSVGAPAEVQSTGVDDGYIELIEALDRVQAATATYFAIPEQFSREDLEAITAADDLLRGEAVSTTWTSFTVSVASEEGLAVWRNAEGPQGCAIVVDYPIEVAGNKINLGQVRFGLRSAQVENIAELRAGPPVGPGEERLVHLVPAGSQDGELRLGVGADEPPAGW